MKPFFRTLLTVVTALFIVSSIGCGGDNEEEMKDESVDFEAVDTTWQVDSINGLKFEQLFKPMEPAEFETDFMLGANSWTFSTEGSFTGTLKFILTEKYTEPISSILHSAFMDLENIYF